MAFTKRGLRLVEFLAKYSKEKPFYFDSANVFNKIKITVANEERLKGIMTVDTSMCNGFDILHGGCIASIMDVTCLYAHIAKTNGRLALTSNISINFIGLAKVGDNIIAEAITVKDGSRPIMESTLYKEDGSLIAKGTACFKNASDDAQKRASLKLGFDMLNTDE